MHPSVLPRPMLHRALPSPTPQNTPEGTGNDWKNLPGTAHTDRQTDTVALIYKIESILVKQFELWTDPQLVFPSCKIVTKNVLPYMMKHTIEIFILPYVNDLIFIITTFHLWMRKGALDFLSLWLFFNIGLRTKTCHNWSIWILRQKTLVELIFLINCNLCLRSTS
jgi:hypothetical protein